MSSITFGIVAQRGNSAAQQLAADIIAAVESDDVSILVDTATSQAIDRPGVDPSELSDVTFVISIGGDGTFLFVAREVTPTPILGVNLGEVGFLNAVSPDDALEVTENLVDTATTQSTLPTQQVERVQAEGRTWEIPPALNEIVLHASQRGSGGTTEFDVTVDGNRYVKTDADGVIIATPTGSTAYNLSEDGPLLHPTVPALVLTLMCPVEPMPPLVVEPSSEIRIDVTGTDEAYAISDGRITHPLSLPATATVTRADEPVQITGPRVNFFEALEKLD